MNSARMNINNKKENFQTVKELLIGVFTLGISSLWVQKNHMVFLNTLERSERFTYRRWIYLSFITGGIYHCYFVFQKFETLEKHFGATLNKSRFCALVFTSIALLPFADALFHYQANTCLRKQRLKSK